MTLPTVVILLSLLGCGASVEPKGKIADKDVDTSDHKEWAPPSVPFVSGEGDLFGAIRDAIPPAAASASSFKIYKYLNSADEEKMIKLLKSSGFRPTPAKTVGTKLASFIRKTPIKGCFLAVAVGEGVLLFQTINAHNPGSIQPNRQGLEAYIRRQNNLNDSQKIELIRELQSTNIPSSRAAYRPYVFAAIAALVVFAIYLVLRHQRILR